MDRKHYKPNRTTIRALKEGDKLANNKKAKIYTDLEKLWKDLKI